VNTRTRERILTLLSQSKAPLSAKIISFELKKNSADIRKILSNLCKAGKIKRISYGKYISVNLIPGESVNAISKSVNLETDEIIRRTINAYHRKNYAEHREAKRKYFNEYHAEHREAVNAYHRKYYHEHLEKMRSFNRKYYALNPERHKEYSRKCWLKKAMKEKAGV
jgi:Fe2+ or Zn2+ uptake regulation protein